MNYYYLGASLPMISMSTPPPVSSVVFKQICEEHLSKADLDALNSLFELKDDDTSNKFVRKWRDKEIQLRNSVAKIRAERTKRDLLQHLRDHDDFDPQVEKSVFDAFSKGDPAEREQAIDKFRWQQLDTLAGFDSFSIEAILSYAMKLRIAERWASMDDKKGAENANKIINRDSEEAL